MLADVVVLVDDERREAGHERVLQRHVAVGRVLDELCDLEQLLEEQFAQRVALLEQRRDGAFDDVLDREGDADLGRRLLEPAHDAFLLAGQRGDAVDAFELLDLLAHFDVDSERLEHLVLLLLLLQLQLLEQVVDVSVDVGSGRPLGGRGGACGCVEDAERVLLALVAQSEQKRFLDVHELVVVFELLGAGDRTLCAGWAGRAYFRWRRTLRSR